MTELNVARLRSARQRHGLTQSELSRTLGVTQALAGQWERGYKDPSLANLKELSRVLRVSLPWLLGMDETSPTIADDPSRYDTGPTPEPRRPRYTSAAEILADYDAPLGLARPGAGAGYGAGVAHHARGVDGARQPGLPRRSDPGGLLWAAGDAAHVLPAG